MNTDEKAPEEVVESADQSSREIVDQLVKICTQSKELEDFYPPLLRQICDGTHAQGAVIWLPSDDEPRAEFTHHVDHRLFENKSPEVQSHRQAVVRAFSDKQCQVIPASTDAHDAEHTENNNPSNSLVFLVPLVCNSEVTSESVAAVLEIFHDRDLDRTSQAHQLQFLLQISRLIGKWLETFEIRQIRIRQELWGGSRSLRDSRMAVSI